MIANDATNTMRILTSIAFLVALLTSNTALAKKQNGAKSSIFVVLPALALNLPFKGDVSGINFVGIGLNHTWDNNLYIAAQITSWVHLVDDLGQTYDLSTGYRFTLNDKLRDSWLVDVVPQVGYRYGRRWYYHRDGFGPENVSHGILVGASYDCYYNSTFGFLVRAHTLFEWAPYSVMAPNHITGTFEDRVFVTGIDVGLSVGLSFGH